MESKSTEFNQIIINDSQEYQTRSSREENKSEALAESNEKEIHHIKDSTIEKDSKIYSIKDETKGKSEVEITNMIGYELEINEDDAVVWNRMVKAISRFRIGNFISS